MPSWIMVYTVNLCLFFRCFFALTEVSLKAESLEQEAEETECGLASPSDIVENESALSVGEGDLGMMLWLTVCHERAFLGLQWP